MNKHLQSINKNRGGRFDVCTVHEKKKKIEKRYVLQSKSTDANRFPPF